MDALVGLMTASATAGMAVHNKAMDLEACLQAESVALSKAYRVAMDLED